MLGRPQPHGEVAALYAAHRLTLVRLGVLLGQDRGVAETIVQGAFVRLLRRSRRGVDASDALEALRRSVVVATRGMRRTGTQPTRTPVTVAAPAPPRGSPTDLTGRAREATVLSLWAGLSDRQVGRTLGIRDATAAALVQDALSWSARDGETPEQTRERVVESLHDQADRVVARDLAATFADVEAQDRSITSHRRRVGMVVMAAAVLVVLAASAVSWLGRPRPVDAQPDPQPRPTATTGADTTPLSSPALAPGERQRSDIPWAAVGAGWVAVATAAPADAVSTTLLLVSPQGTRYVVGTSPEGMTLQDISPDGRKALLAIGSEAFEWDLEAGTSRRIGSAYGWKTLHYAGVDAGYLVLWTDSGSQLRLERRTADGRLRMEYPVALAPTAGSPGTPALVVSADGKTAFVAARDGGVYAVDLATDAVGMLRLPDSSQGCTPRDRADSTAVLVVCRSGPDPVLMTSAGSAAPQPVPGLPDRVVGAWQSSIGTLVQRGDTECSAELVMIGGADGLTRPVPSGPGAGLVPNQTVGETLLLGGTRCAIDGSRLVAYDLRTGTTTELTGEDAGGRAVRQAVVVRPIG